MDAALHVEGGIDALQDALQAAIQHGGWCSAANIKGGYRPVSNQVCIDANFFDHHFLLQPFTFAMYHHFSIPLRNPRLINHFVVGAVRANLAAERNMQIEAERIDFLNFLAYKRHLVFKDKTTGFSQALRKQGPHRIL